MLIFLSLSLTSYLSCIFFCSLSNLHLHSSGYHLLNLVEKKKNFYDEDVTTTEAAADFFMLDDEEVDFAMSATPSMDTAAPFSLP